MFTAVAVLPAQTSTSSTAKPAASSSASSGGEIVQLGEFTVSAEKDLGYATTNAIGVTRTNTPIIDTPQSVNVINQEFLRDAVASELFDVLKYVSGVSIESNVGDSVMIRGYTVRGQYTDGLSDNQNQTQAGSEPFQLPITFDSSNADDQLIANILQTALGEIGIEVVQDKVPTAVFSQKIGQKEDYAYLSQNWPPVADPGYALWVYWYSTNFLNAANYDNQEFDELLNNGMGTLDEAERFAMFDRAQEIYEADQPWVLLVNQRFQLAMSPRLTGFTWHTDNHVHYEHLSVTE